MTAPGREGARTNGAKARPIEVELKYRPTSLAAGERILAADEIAGLTPSAAARRTQFEDRYVDTAGGALGRAGFATRIRTTPRGTIVSLKSTARTGDGGVHRREEHEGPASTDLPPLDWPPSDARSMVMEIAGDGPLVEVVTIRQVRRRRVLRDAAAAVELSLDEVEVVADGTVIEQWIELEVELADGDEGRLLDVGRVLAADGELAPAQGSKLDSALAAVRARAEPSTPSEAAPQSLPKTPGVMSEDHIAEAGRKILRFHFARMVDRQAGTREGSEMEDLHKMRVATRRMRAGWRIFGDAFRAGRTKRMRNRLREIADRLGAVRDLDVQLEGLDAYRAELAPTEQRALDPLAAAWRSYRDDARELLVREMDSEGYARFVEDFRAFVQTEGMAVRDTGPTEAHHVRDTAPSRVWAAYEQVRAYEGVIRWADVETLHELRIAAKWLRYSMEFVSEPLGREVAELVPRVVALQDHLGLMHDADVSAAMARAFLTERAGSLSAIEAAAIGRYLVSREREVARLKRTVGGAWRGVAGLAFRRRLGRAVSSL